MSAQAVSYYHNSVTADVMLSGQFIFEGPLPTTLDGGNGLLKIIDVSGEEHSQEFTVIYDEFMRKGLN